MLQQWDLPLMINISLNGCECNKYIEKCLLKMFFDRWWSLDGVKTDQCEIFNFVDLCNGVGIVCSTTTRTQSVMPLLSLSLLNVLTH